MEEIWKDIKGYEGIYQVSNYGKIRSLDRIDKINHFHKGRILKPASIKGYLHVNLSVDGNINDVAIHRVVAETFIPNPHNLPQINHKDENKQNNMVTNLEFCTPKHNVNYGTRTIRASISQSGEKSHKHKLTQKEVEEIKSIYKRKSKDFNQKKLAQKYNVSFQEISNIIRGKKWKYNTEE